MIQHIYRWMFISLGTVNTMLIPYGIYQAMHHTRMLDLVHLTVAVVAILLGLWVATAHVVDPQVLPKKVTLWYVGTGTIHLMFCLGGMILYPWASTNLLWVVVGLLWAITAYLLLTEGTSS